MFFSFHMTGANGLPSGGEPRGSQDHHLQTADFGAYNPLIEKGGLHPYHLWSFLMALQCCGGEGRLGRVGFAATLPKHNLPQTFLYVCVCMCVGCVCLCSKCVIYTTKFYVWNHVHRDNTDSLTGSQFSQGAFSKAYTGWSYYLDKPLPF